MAQYYQLLSQGSANKSTVEELKQYYPNLIEANQTVQYVINPDDQQFQGQQILVSSDQLMVIDNSQHVIVDQSPLTYQSQQFIVQDNSNDYQDGGGTQQQIYYMEEVDSERISSEPQPIVLNHQLQPNTPVRTPINMNSVVKTSPNRQQQILQMHQPPPQAQSSNVRQIVQRARTSQHISHEQPHILQHRNPTAAHLARQQLQQNNPQTRNEQVPHQTLHVESDDHEAVALADGRIMGKAAYKQMMADSKRVNSLIATNQKQNVLPPQNKFCMEQTKPKGRTSTRGRGGVGGGTKRVNNIATRISSNPLQFSFQNNANRFNNPQQQSVRPPNQLKSHIPQPTQFNLQQQPLLQHPRMQQHSSRQHPTYKQPQYIIQPPSQHQQHASCPLPSYVASSQIQQIIENTPVSEEYSDSIRMLVLLEDGEQRLITFTLPKEQCTIQEILEQVSVPFRPDTKIECTETNHAGINYLVTVGACHSEKVLSKEEDELEDVNTSSQKSEPEVVPPKPQSPEPPVEVELAKYVPGLLAVCNHCGYTSENLAKCLRCTFRLPEDVKTISTIDANINNGKKSDMLQALQAAHDKKFSKESVFNTKLPNGGPGKKKKAKVVDPDPVILTLSSDEDEESSQSNQSETQQLLKKLSHSVTLSAIKKEPSASDFQQVPAMTEVDSTSAVRGGGKEDSFESLDNNEVSTTLYCRTIRIGSYRYVPKESLVIKAKGIVLKVPSLQDPNDIKTIVIERKHMIKVLANFQKALPVIFYYVNSVISSHIREQLGMVEGSEIYFDPLSNEETHKRITILPEIVHEEMKVAFKHIYTKPSNIMDELTTKEANDILVKTCPKEISKVVLNAGYTEIRAILIYPPGKGGISINTEDYLCLAQDQFLNDVIIDFYLKYLVHNLPQEVQEKVHVFSTFFYKRLTTKPLKPNKRSHPAEVDATLSAAQKRHARVEKWTKSVNLFDKDYIIIPINESSHWFLAIICFPSMDGCTTFDGKPVSVEPKRKKPSLVSSLGNHISITPIKKEKEEKAIPCEDDDISDKDEAEGDDSEMESDSEEVEVPESQPIQAPSPRKLKLQPIKQPCIIIFDSLAGASRSRVVATLRDYLTCEYKAKMGKEKIFDKDVIRGCCPRVPQQTNFTDCGLYLLQYVEQFFEDPISDYNIPIKQLKEWFDEFVVTKKREDISNLIMDLMIKSNRDPSLLPDLVFPTLNGKLVVNNHDDEEDEFMDEFADDEEEEEGEGDESPLDSSDFVEGSVNSESHNDSDVLDNSGPLTGTQIKINLSQSKEVDKNLSEENNKQCADSFVAQSGSLKADTSELLKQSSSRETLCYLKSKRITRHKSNDHPDLKKFKPSFE